MTAPHADPPQTAIDKSSAAARDPGLIPGPHFDVRRLTYQPQLDLPEVAADPPPADTPDAGACQSIPLELGVQIHASGLNGALQRNPKPQVLPIPLFEGCPVSRWKPYWGRHGRSG